MTDAVAKVPRVRLSEVVASLSLATDLAGGLPLEHGLRRCLLAVSLGGRPSDDGTQYRYPDPDPDGQGGLSSVTDEGC